LKPRPALRTARRGANRPPPLLVIIRGPIGAGKTTLLNGLGRDRRFKFFLLDTDRATDYHPGDPFGKHLDDEWPIEVQILALHAKIVLGRGLNLVMDPGIFLTVKEVDRFLRLVGRSRKDPRVVLFRLTASPAVAVKRKTTLRPSYIRASHKGWQPTAIRGEVVIDTNGRTARQVLGIAKRALRNLAGAG
jgi:hypothetical protein